MGEITLQVAQFVNTEQLQQSVPQKCGWFRVYNCKYLHKGDSKDDNDNDDNSNNNMRKKIFLCWDIN